MASDGSRGPKPYQQHRHSTRFLRVPARDWPLVKRGYKTEFRAGMGNSAVSQFWAIPTPAPVVAYSIRNGRHDAQLMMLEDCWQEPLGAISPESLRNEGFPDLAAFRSYWMEREKRRFSVMRKVFVYRLRQFESSDIEPAALALFEHLYGDFLTGVAA